MAKRSTFKLKSNVDNVLKELGDEAEERVEKATHHLRNEVEKTLSGQRSGKVYKVPDKKNAYYTASAPGEPPASATGRLRTSIGWKIMKGRAMFGLGAVSEIRGRVGTPLPYGAKLETGEYPSGPNTKVARPFLGPTEVRERQAIKRILGGRKWL